MPRVSQSKWFNTAVEKAFSETDVDKDGALDVKELHIAVLKLYDVLNAKLPCHVKVPKHAQVAEKLKMHDSDKTGKLALPEFKQLCTNLFASRDNWRDNLIVRIGFAVLMKAAILPLAAFGIKKGIESAGWPDVGKKLPAGILVLGMDLATKPMLPL